MSEQKLGQDSAFPLEYVSDGMSKRFYAACAAMQGLSSTELNGLSFTRAAERAKEVVKIAYVYADELLKQENE